MFEHFAGAYRVDPGPGSGAWRDDRLTRSPGYRELALSYAGRSVEHGLYYVHDATSGPASQRLAEEAFPDFAGRFCVFAGDWLGRQYAVDAQAAGEGLLMLLPESGEVLEIPVGLDGFHDGELVDHAEEVLSLELLRAWAGVPGRRMPVPWQECVGHTVPLFLGGENTLANLEITDREVYWSLSGQLRLAVAGLPDGTPIPSIATDDQ